MSDDQLRLYTTKEADALRTALISDHIVPAVEKIRVTGAEVGLDIRSAVLCVAQFWNDEANDAVHFQLLVSQLDQVDVAAGLPSTDYGPPDNVNLRAHPEKTDRSTRLLAMDILEPSMPTPTANMSSITQAKPVSRCGAFGTTTERQSRWPLPGARKAQTRTRTTATATFPWFGFTGAPGNGRTNSYRWFARGWTAYGPSGLRDS